MADPNKYVPSYSFSGWQASNPSKPLPAPQVDAQFANIATSLGQTIDGLKDIRRSDGKLQNGIVTVDSVEPGFAEELSGGLAAAAAASAAAAAISATSAAASAASAAVSASGASQSMAGAAAAQSAAQALVVQATAGFAGFIDGLGYDFGQVSDPVTYFNQDWGSV